MIRSSSPIRDGNSADVLALFHDVAKSWTCADTVFEGTGIAGQYGGVDGQEALILILRSLTVLTGSEEAAVEWLFNSRGYAKVVGNDACLGLENGDFWSLNVMQEWLQVLEAHRLTCPLLIDAIFGASDR